MTPPASIPRRRQEVGAVVVFLTGFLLLSFSKLTAAAHSRFIGVCNGRVANNLPSEADVVSFYKSKGITKMRIYEANQFTLHALKNTNIELVLGVANEVIPSLAADPSAADAWVRTNILSYSPAVKYRYVAVGNEIMPNDPIAGSVLPAMKNIHNTLASSPYGARVKVSTAIRMDLLANTYPPSAGVFADGAKGYILPIVQFLAGTGAPLLANVYPYFAYVGSSGQVRLDYATFRTGGRVVVKDGRLGYRNLFHAMVDSIYAALEKAGAPNLQVVVTETGWPSAGGEGATVGNAGAYYLGLTNGTVTNGTPKKPRRPVETYLFAMFDENQKPGAASEQHFGLFTPDKRPKYPLIKFR